MSDAFSSGHSAGIAGTARDYGDTYAGDVVEWRRGWDAATAELSDRRFITKDSGQREEWATGSQRDTREGKGRYDLLSPIAIKRLAQLLERGAAKYGDRNWEKGQPLSRFLDSGMRHLFQVLAGDADEDHAAAVMWNLAAFIHTQELVRQGKLPAELDDLPGGGG